MRYISSNPLRTMILIAAYALSTGVTAQSVQLEITDPPENHNFGKIPLGANYAAQYFSIFNRSGSALQLGKVSVDTAAAGDFLVGNSDGCSGATLQPNQGCSTLVGFVPTEVGARTARLVFPVLGSSTLVTRIVQGTGTTQPLDCVLDWAESQFPSLLSSPSATLHAAQFYARCYQGGALCVGADAAAPSFAPASIYLYQNQKLQLLGTLSAIASTAQCAQN